MSDGSEAVKKWRKNSKLRMLEAMGGKCNICHYDRCVDALEFHHLDPSKKDFGVGKVRRNPKKWSLIIEELKKCILLCSNCHREVHSGITKLPITYSKFDESFIDYKHSKDDFDKCPVCGRDKPVSNKSCSLKCGGQLKGKVDWSSFDLKSALESGLSYIQIGHQLNCSESAVRKRAIKLKLHDLNKFKRIFDV